MKIKKKFIVAIDQGTTSSRAILFNTKGIPLFKSQLEFKQYFPKNGWVEHNPEEIWNKTKKVLADVIKKSKKLNGDILTIGITNQRETTILWDKISGKTVYNAIVWQDRRTEKKCNELKRIVKNQGGSYMVIGHTPQEEGINSKCNIVNIPSEKIFYSIF